MGPRSSAHGTVGGTLTVACLYAALIDATGAVAATALTPTNADGQVEIVLKDHRFVPSEIHVAAGLKAQLLIKNQDATADEFDSTALKVEKVIGTGKEGVVRLRELEPGRYPFIGEFHAETARGVVVAE